MQEKEIAFQFNARYYQSGPITPTTRQIWVAFHGYGQLGRFFGRKFEKLTQRDIVVVVPEGLSRFYLSELTESGRKDNKVGATWMTAENRLMDIRNYLAYLDGIHAAEINPHPHIPVTLFGFSQGCATVCRWATQGNVNFDRLILWAGIFPPDMDFKAGHEILEKKKTYLVVGDQDPYLVPERMQEFNQLSQKLDIEPEKLVFNGKHEIIEEVLLRFA